MGTIARSLLTSFREEAHALAEAAERFAESLPSDMPSPEQLAEEGYDPQHILFIAAQRFAASFSESALGLEEFAEYADEVERAEEEYMPSSPPMSPLTHSFFGTWALFDLRFGADRETVGGCLIELMRAIQAPEEMLVSLSNYNESRMGIYEHLGMRGGKIRLLELITGDEFLCHSTSGYSGKKGELWYVRLCAPLNDGFDYHVAVTTPYVLTDASAEDWTAYLNKHMMAAKDKHQSLHELLKYGCEGVDWMEFVFHAYHHYQFDAIFLAGIPDVAASLPHSPIHDESEAVSGEEPIEVVRVRLSEVQRKVVAELCPEFASRLRLSEKNQRTIELQQKELETIVASAEAVLPNTKGPRRNSVKKIIDLANPTPKRRVSPVVTPAATIYQFKVTLAGIKPPIWRRIQVEDCTLADLHYAIQSAMGWYNCHLHEFEIDGQRYAAPIPFPMGMDDDDALDASTTKLNELIDGQNQFRCRYVYDFGDSWDHMIELEEIRAAEPQAKYPRCTGGKRACPPEDCGGIGGYYEFVEAMSNRKHPEHSDLKEWHGGPFNADAFDPQKATREMRR